MIPKDGMRATDHGPGSVICFIFLLFMPLFAVRSQWEQLPQYRNDTFITIAANGNRLFASIHYAMGARADIATSGDHGITWIRSWTTTDSLWQYATAFARDSTGVFAGTSHGLYRSSNNGQSWVKVGSGPDSTDILSLWIDDNHIYAGADKNTVYVSEDHGSTWRILHQFLNYVGDQGQATDVFSFDTALFVRITPYTFISSKQTIFRSLDGGRTWGESARSDSNLNLFKIFNGLFCTLSLRKNSTLYQSEDYGNTWNNSGNFFADKFLRRPLTDQIGGMVINAAYQYESRTGNLIVKIYESHDSGSSWNEITAGLDTHAEPFCLTHDDKYLYLGTYLNGLWRYPLSQLLSARESSPTKDRIALQRNYPNPFTEQTHITFTVPKQSSYSLRLYDAFGRCLQVIGEGKKEEDVSVVEIESAGLRSGIYYYLLECEGVRIVRSCCILR